MTPTKKQPSTPGKRQTASKRAGIQFPVARVKRYLKDGGFAPHISQSGSIYLASVLEYLSAELLELAGMASKHNKKSRIIPRHIQLAIFNDLELSKLCEDVIIPEGGVAPYIHPILLPKNSQKRD